MAKDDGGENQAAMKQPRQFGQLPNLAVVDADTFDDPLPETEIVAWEGKPPS